jgi:hypothetical protein
LEVCMNAIYSSVLEPVIFSLKFGAETHFVKAS